MTDPAVFVSKIWALHGLTGPDVYACVSHKDWTTGDWQDRRVSPAGAARWVGNSDLTDLYFAPVLFSKPARQKEYYLPSRVLYADLDESDPEELGELRPTLAWTTSAGRWQALWVLNRPIPSLSVFESLNRRLTYATGADKGGWASVKVLRIPGTVSTKYGRSRAKRFTVAMVGGKGPKYRLEDLMAMLPKDVARPKSTKNLFGEIDTLPDRKVVLDEWMARLPMRARQLLRTRHAVVGDDRSAKLWEMYNLLLQAGMRPAEVLVAVQGTVWNKYAGQRRELAQLQREISKAAAKHAEPDEIQRALRANGKNGHNKKMRGAVGRRVAKRHAEQGDDALPYMTLEEFMQHDFPAPQWLVDGVWELGAYGIWAGVYKGYKTTTLLDFMLSVGSGLPFLGRFKVHNPGQVLYVHEEGREGQLQDRIHRIMSQKQLAAKVRRNGRPGNTVLEAPQYPPIHIASFTGFKLSDEKSQRRLVSYLAKNPQVRVVVMESWYLMAGDIDENRAAEVEPVLEWLGRVARDFEAAIIISHHYNKSQDEDGHRRRSADRVSGSGVFGRWWESAVFTDRKGEEDEYRATFEAQHRGQKGVGKLELQFEMDTENEDNYEVVFIDKPNSDALRAGRVEIPLGKESR